MPLSELARAAGVPGARDARSCARCSRRACSSKASLSGDADRRPGRAAGAEGQRRRPAARPRLPGADHRPGAARRAQHQVGRVDRVRGMTWRAARLTSHLLPHLRCWALVERVQRARARTASMGDRDLAARRRDPARPPAAARCTRALDRLAQRALRGATSTTCASRPGSRCCCSWCSGARSPARARAPTTRVSGLLVRRLRAALAARHRRAVRGLGRHLSRASTICRTPSA